MRRDESEMARLRHFGSSQFFIDYQSKVIEPSPFMPTMRFVQTSDCDGAVLINEMVEEDDEVSTGRHKEVDARTESL